MSGCIRVEIIDKDNWRKEITLEKPLIYIGSDPIRDVYLEPGRGSGVALLHAQLIPASGSDGNRLVNLSGSDILIGENAQALSPDQMTEIADGCSLKIGDYTLILHFEGDSVPSGTGGSGRNISMSVVLPYKQLEAGKSITGKIRVRNLGDSRNAQIELNIEGLDQSCYSIEPGPVLSSGVEKDVSFRIYHLENKPPAGKCQFTICASAPRAYPDEEIRSIQTIQVAPVYAYTLRLVAPAEGEAETTRSGILRPQAGGKTTASKLQPTSTDHPAARKTLSPPGGARRPSTDILSPLSPGKSKPETKAAQQPTAAPPATKPAQSIIGPLPAPASGAGWLGVQGMPVNAPIALAMGMQPELAGLLIVQVQPGSPAEAARLRPSLTPATIQGRQVLIGGDIITAIDDTPFKTGLADLKAWLSGKPGQVLKLDILRDGKRIQVPVILSAQPGAKAPAPVPVTAPQAVEPTNLPKAEPKPIVVETAAPVPVMLQEAMPDFPQEANLVQIPAPLPVEPQAAEPQPVQVELAEAVDEIAQQPAALPVEPAITPREPDLAVQEEAPQVEVEPVETQAQPDDWWGEAQPATESTPGVLQIKAKPAAEKRRAPAAAGAAERKKERSALSDEKKTPKVKTGASNKKDEWWPSAEPASAEVKPVIQLKAKASPAPDKPASEKPASGTDAKKANAQNDWWSAGDETEEEA